MVEWGGHARFVWNAGVARVLDVFDHPQAQPHHLIACERDPSRRRNCIKHGCPKPWMPQWLWREVWKAINSLGGISTELRARHEWLAAGPSHIQQDVERDLHRAFVNWLDSTHPARRPRFHARNSRASFNLRRPSLKRAAIDRWPDQHGGLISGRFRCVHVPKVGLVKFRADRPLPTDLSSARVVREPAGDWFISFTDTPPAREHQSTGVAIGIDVGVVDTIHVADGERTWAMRMPDLLTPGETQRLCQLERHAARQQGARKGEQNSNSRQRTITSIARLRARQARRRQDWIEKTADELVKLAGLIVVEDLRVRNMTASAVGTVDEPGRNVKAKSGLNRALLATAPARLRKRLEDKCREAGIELVAVNPRNTSRTCSACGTIDADSRQGKRFCCRSCGVGLDADANSAINIRALGLSARRREGISSLRGRQAHTQAGNGAIREPSVLAPETLSEGTIQHTTGDQETTKVDA